MSAAVGAERIASVTGYDLSEDQLQNSTSNLPQRVASLCEANHANNVVGLDTSEWTATNLKAVGDRYGYGSPAYLIARIALPILGGIPLVFYPQQEAGGATAKVITVSPIGTATANATHTIVIAGREGVDAQFYNITINTGDHSADITAKISDAVNNVLGAPMTCVDSEYDATFTSKWKGLTADDLNISVNTNNNDAGISYTINSSASGAGTPSISSALDLMKSKWNTIIINSYGTNSTIASALETFNGIPDATTPTGQYVGTVMKPGIYLTGSCAEDPSSFTDGRKNQVTISISPSPLAKVLPMETAASDAATWAVLAQNKPALDVLNKPLVDIPAPAVIGAMSDYNERDRIVKLGCSTSDLVNDQYVMKDPVTTYHPDGELNPAYRWRRDLMVDFNIRYRYRILEETFLVGKVIADDSDDVSNNTDIIKPKNWKQILITSLFKGLNDDGLITLPKFSADSLLVSIDTNNPNRFNTFFRYKKTGVARISATTAASGVNVGSINL